MALFCIAATDKLRLIVGRVIAGAGLFAAIVVSFCVAGWFGGAVLEVTSPEAISEADMVRFTTRGPAPTLFASTFETCSLGACFPGVTTSALT